MTRIVNNQLLHQNDEITNLRRITNWNSTFITSDGPNLSSKIDLVDLGIPYDSHYRSRIVLPAGSEGFFLNYGLIENVTFLLIKVTYNGNFDYAMEDSFDPLYQYEPNTYSINYYFEGNSGKTYPIGRLLILNGSFTTPLTKIYLNNPLDFDVVLDVLHANIDSPESTPTSSAITISNLYYNDIITDSGVCSSNSGYTGSTGFIISEYVPILTGYTLYEYYIAYDTIISFHRDSTYPIIFLYTNSYTIYLKFLTQFDCDQAYSRMVFAYNSYLLDLCSYLTQDGSYQNNSGSTGPDITPPVIYYNSAPSGITWVGSGVTVPHGAINPVDPPATSYIFLPLVYSGVTGWTLDSLRNLFISGVTDNFDGNIALSSITFNLYSNGFPAPITGITESGIYNIVISATDNAGNVITQYIINICVDDKPPVIVYQWGVLSPALTGNTTTYSGASSAITSGIIVTSGFSLNLTGFTPVLIDRMAIIDTIVDYVYDLIDIDLNKYMLDVLIVGLDGTQTYYLTYSGVSNPGLYLVKLSVSDSSGNEVVNYLIMNLNYIESCFSFGFWKDERVWIDETYWGDMYLADKFDYKKYI